MADSFKAPLPPPPATAEPAPAPRPAPVSGPPAPIPTYVPPEWSACPPGQVTLEVLKDGVILETLKLPMDKEFVMIGRLPSCDVSLEHASVSRYHAVLQFKNTGQVYLYDLGSTHGTRLNKELIPTKEYVPVRLGSFLRFGESTRNFVLTGSPQQMSAGDNAQQLRTMVAGSLAARKEKHLKQLEENQARAAVEQTTETPGISWGMAEDATEEDENGGGEDTDGAGGADDDTWYMRDPKRILRGWFDYHGEQMEIKVEEDGPGHARVYHAKLRLPIEGPHGTEVFAIATASKKRDAEREVVIDACQKLNGRGILRTNDPAVAAELLQAKKRRLRELFGDDDDDKDEFYDRTAAKKQQKAAASSQPQTYESLMAQREDLLRQKSELVQKHAKISAKINANSAEHDEDDLDAYVEMMAASITSEDANKVLSEIKDVEMDMLRVEKLIKIAKPTSLPTFGMAKDTLPPIPLPTAPPTKADIDTVLMPPPAFPMRAPVKPLPSPHIKGSAKDPEHSEDNATRPRTLVRLDDTDEHQLIETRPGTDADVLPADSGKHKKKRIFGAQTLESYEVEVAKDMSDWAPPSNQTGDGRTSLNDKFGY